MMIDLNYNQICSLIYMSSPRVPTKKKMILKGYYIYDVKNKIIRWNIKKIMADYRHEYPLYNFYKDYCKTPRLRYM